MWFSGQTTSLDVGIAKILIQLSHGLRENDIQALKKMYYVFEKQSDRKEEKERKGSSIHWLIP